MVPCMKRFLPVAACLLTLPLFANEAKKDPDVQARENLKMAKCMKEEAQHMEKAALQLEGADAKTVSEYAKLTAEEAEWLVKSSEAIGKNQFGLAERFQRKAAENCEKRGKLMGKIDALRHKMKEASCEEKPCKDKPASAADKLAEIERKQAELEKEKKRLLEKKAD